MFAFADKDSVFCDFYAAFAGAIVFFMVNTASCFAERGIYGVYSGSGDDAGSDRNEADACVRYFSVFVIICSVTFGAAGTNISEGGCCRSVGTER